MIKIKKEELLKNVPDYEDYSENICVLSIEEMKAEGLLKCGGCCSDKEKGCKDKNSKKCSECSGCKCKKMIL